MSGLAKAGADARHFLAKFKSVVQLAEMVDGLSGLSGEVVALEAAKEEAAAALMKVKPLLATEQKKLSKAIAAIKDAETESAYTIEEALQGAKAIRADADTAVRLQLALDVAEFTEFQVEAAKEKKQFSKWQAVAEKRKETIVAQTDKLTRALDSIRAKLL